MKVARFKRASLGARSLVCCVFLIACGLGHAGSYDDFFSAIKRDEPATVEGLLLRGFDANTVSPAGDPGLLMAIRDQSLKVTGVLLKWPKTKVEARNLKDESPLMLASLKGLTEVCKQLINQGADVNKPGWTPLHYASTSGHLAVMELLLENYAYIDASSPNGTTPLMMAAHYGSTAAVTLLLEAGADPLLKNDLGLTAIDFAQRVNRQDAAELIASHIRRKQPKGVW